MALRLPEEADPAQSAQLRVQPWRPFGSDLLEAEGVNVSSASWQLFEGTNADVRQHEEELFVCGSNVIWSSGRVLRRRYTTAPVLQVALCRFQGSAESNLCLLHSGCLTTWAPSGDTQVVPLSHDVQSLWPTPLGLLLQRIAHGTLARYHLDALLSPLESTTPAQVAHTWRWKIVWSHSILPLVVVSAAGAVALLRVEEVPQDPDLPAGVQSRCLQFATLWEHDSATPSSPGILLGEADSPSSVCLAHDRDGAPLVCIVNERSKQLTAVRVECDAAGLPVAATPAFVLDAVAAAPLAATRPCPPLGQPVLDLLVMSPNGELHLHVGRVLACTCTFPQHGQSSFADSSARGVSTGGSSGGMDMTLTPVVKTQSALSHRTPRTGGSDGSDAMDMELTPLSAGPAPSAALHSARPGAAAQQRTPATPAPNMTALHLHGQGSIVNLVDACGSHVNALMSDGARYRMSLPLAPVAPRLHMTMAMLRDALPEDVYTQLERQYNQSSAATGDSADDAWDALSSIILRASGVPDTQAADVSHASPWDALLASRLHERCATALPDVLAPAAGDLHGSVVTWPTHPGGAAVGVAQAALDALHALYEDCKLDSMRQHWMQPLARLSTRLAAWTGDAAYVEHYQRDWGASCMGTAIAQTSVSPPRSPPDILRALHLLLCTGDINAMAQLLPWPLPGPDEVGRGTAHRVSWSYSVCLAYAALAAHGPVGVPPVCTAAGIDTVALARLPVGVALPLQEACARVRAAPPEGWPPAAYLLIRRPDLAAAAGHKEQSESQLEQDTPAPLASLLDVLSTDDHVAVDRLDLNGRLLESGGGGEQEAVDGADAEPDGMDDMTHVVGPLRFGRDARLLEVRRLLCSARPVPLRHGEGPGEGGDPDALIGGSQGRLWALASRTCALPLGRGAFTLGTWRPLPTATLPVPALCLAGRLTAAHNATVQLSLTSPGAPQNFTCWPEFHNGCAAGLRFAGADVTAPLTRTWILHGRSKERSNQQAGVLLAFGLAGHLTALSQPEQFSYLEGEHMPTTVALLLGLGASRAGTSHGPTSRTLFLHLPSKHPASFPELELPHTVQAAALLGVGLLYRGTAHRAMVDTLLGELRRASSGPEMASDGREGHALAAGLALGLVLLGHGRGGTAHVDDLRVSDHLASLLRYDASAAAAAAEHAMPADTRGPGDDPHDRLAILPVLRAVNGDQAVPNPYARGGGLFLPGTRGVNLGVTAPGATLALGLWFLRTNDAGVAAQLHVPCSPCALDEVRPEHLLLRVVARSMVMWDTVNGSMQWVDAQLPRFLASALAVDSSGCVEPQSGAEDAGQHPGGGAQGTRPPDRDSMATAAAYIRAGACLSLGLRFAGTCHAGAVAVLRRHIILFLDLKRVKAPTATASGSTASAAVDKHALETCLCCSTLGLCCVLAGSGNLDALRLLRSLRRRVEMPHHPSAGGGPPPQHGAVPGGSITYGSHLAISLATGLLFLGGGTHTLSTSPAATAALLAAVVPPFPASAMDNQGHLQALRHLYVLAAVCRDVRAVDADTGMPCYAPVQLRYADGATRDACAPFCTPSAQEVAEMRVLGPRHWPLAVRGSFLRAVLRGEAPLLVKRRPGCLPYHDDPRGTRSLLSRALAVDDTAQGAALQMQSHLRSACADVGTTADAMSYAFLLGAADEALPAYLSLHSTMKALQRAGSVPKDAPLCVLVHNLRLCSALYAGKLWRSSLGGGPGIGHVTPLVQATFVEGCSQNLAAALEQRISGDELRAYLSGQGVRDHVMGAFLLLHMVPFRATLVRGMSELLQEAAVRTEESHPLPLPLLQALLNR